MFKEDGGYNYEEMEPIIGSNITAMQFDDLWVSIGAPTLDDLSIVGMTEEEFDHPTLDSLYKLKQFELQRKTSRHM